MELYNMSIGNFHYLHCMVLNEQKDTVATERKRQEMASDAIEESM